MLRFLATADVHLGRRSTALPEGVGGLPTTLVWEQIVETAITREVDALLLSGDIIDRANRYFEALGPLRQGLAKLAQSNIQVVMVAGNHDFDVLRDVTREESYSHVKLLGENGRWEQFRFEKSGQAVQFLGWSFPQVHYRQNPLASFSEITWAPDVPTIGLLHGEVAAESAYAPLDTDELLNAGIDFWLLGHIHKPMQWSNASCQIHYPGSPQALSPKEETQHGALLISVDNQAGINTDPIPLSTVRYESITIDVSDLETENALRSRLHLELEKQMRAQLNQGNYAPEHFVATAVLTGEHPDIPLLERIAKESFGQYVFNTDGTTLSVRKVEMDVQPAVSNLSELAEDPSPAGMLAKAIIELDAGKRSGLVQHLEQAWAVGFDKVSSSAAYGDLRNRGKDEPFFNTEQKARRAYLLKACRRLLAHLIQQQNKSAE